jgi:hypothetical protein
MTSVSRLMAALLVLSFVPACSQPGAKTTTAPPPTSSPAGTRSEPRAQQSLNAEQLAARLKQAGVPLRTTKVYTAANDPNHQIGRPGGYTSKVAFVDGRVKRSEVHDDDPLSTDLGGTIEVFADPRAAKERSAYVQRSIKAMGGILTHEYHYMSGGMLVRVSGLLTPSEAKAYEKALAQI